MVCFRFLGEVVMGGEKKGREEKRRKKNQKVPRGNYRLLARSKTYPVSMLPRGNERCSIE